MTLEINITEDGVKLMRDAKFRSWLISTLEQFRELELFS